MSKLLKMAVACLVLVAGVAQADTMYDWTTSGSFAVGKSGTLTMPADGEVYLKLSGIKAGNTCTFVANGNGASVEVMYTYSEDGDLWDGILASSSPDAKTADQERCIVYYDDWTSAYIVIEDPEDKEWKISPKGYFLHVMGEAGAAILVTSSAGVVEEQIPLGDVDNPKTITPGTLPATLKSKFVENEYYFNATLKKGNKYLFATTGGTAQAPLTLAFAETSSAKFTVTDVSAQAADPGNSAYLLEVTTAGTLEGHLISGGTESFGLSYQMATAGGLCKLTVQTKGAKAQWQIKGVQTKYDAGETVQVLGKQTIVFAAATGFTTPANQEVTPEDGVSAQTIVGVYKDKFDPKDDVVGGATKLSPSAKVGTAARTFFADDPADYFSFAAKAGVFYNFELADLEGDAEFTISDAKTPNVVLAGPTTKLVKFQATAGNYLLKVAHKSGAEPQDAQYTLTFSSASVGTVAFSSAAVSAKKSAGSVKLTVKRSSAEGKIRVRYGTVNDTAKPGVDYVAQEGEFTWENGDKSTRTIEVKLIPELYATEAISRKFSVQLQPIPEEELGEDEYPAVLDAKSGVAVVTVTEAKGKTPTAVKAATVKTETVPLETGTFQGVIAEDGSALTNGFPALASVTFTAKNATKKALSAKVMVAGKTYTFAGEAWDPALAGEGTVGAVLTQVQKVGTVTYTNTLEVTMAAGATATTGDWLKAGAEVVLTMNVPDANGKGAQEDVVYVGELFRDNSKIQDYLLAVTNAVGYYTVALLPSGVSTAEGIPAGNGYLTLTLDNKGKAKIAGMLADGTTKPSYSSIVAVRDDGDTLLVPVYVAKSPYCFGGVIKLTRNEAGVYVVDSSETLLWNNDNAALTYGGEEGWSIDLDPVGGYFNTINNLQAYYLTCAFSVSTGEVDEFPTEPLAEGFSYVIENQPNGTEVKLSGDAFSTDKKTLVKEGSVYDLVNSINPCNVQVKLARATGLVTGSFSLWSETSEDKQKEISGLKHYGVLLLSRDATAPLDPEALTAGFCNQTATIKYTDAKGSSKTRKYTASLPFNVMATDQGEPDWYAEDWGERPQE